MVLTGCLQPIAIAVICEEWHFGADALWTFVQVTTPANRLISRITDRMPAILPRDTWPLWLGEIDASPDAVRAVLQTDLAPAGVPDLS